MKKIATLSFAFILVASFTQAQTFSDDFESYTPGILLGPQSPDWGTWTGAGGGADDVLVDTMDNHTVGGSQSLYFSSTSATGGPSDVVLEFNPTPLTAGLFSYTNWMKIPTGGSAYFNFQAGPTIGAVWTLETFMAGGFLDIKDNAGVVMISSTHPFDTWFEITITANLTTNTWELFNNGVSAGTWTNTVNQVWAIDIYPGDAVASYWIDDVSFQVGTVGIAEANSSNASFNMYPNPTKSNSNITINLDKASQVDVAIYSVQGALVSKKDLGQRAGQVILPIDMLDLKSGLYFVNVTVDGKTSVQKLIKE